MKALRNKTILLLLVGTGICMAISLVAEIITGNIPGIITVAFAWAVIILAAIIGYNQGEKNKQPPRPRKWGRITITLGGPSGAQIPRGIQACPASLSGWCLQMTENHTLCTTKCEREGQ